MNKLALLVTLLAMSGCQTMREHPKATAFIASSLVISAGLALNHHVHSSDPVEQGRMSIPLIPDCAKFPEMCK